MIHDSQKLEKLGSQAPDLGACDLCSLVGALPIRLIPRVIHMRSAVRPTRSFDVLLMGPLAAQLDIRRERPRESSSISKFS